MSKSTPFSVLSDLLRPYADKLVIKHDTDSNFYVEEALSAKKNQMFGAVQIKKNYTSFHLFPVYTDPSLLDNLPPDLLKRMQGKSCFNFNSVDQIPVEELKKLLKRAFATVSG